MSDRFNLMDTLSSKAELRRWGFAAILMNPRYGLAAGFERLYPPLKRNSGCLVSLFTHQRGL